MGWAPFLYRFFSQFNTVILRCPWDVGFFFLIKVVFKEYMKIPSQREFSDNASATSDQAPEASLVNPASKFCKENGGVLELITAKDGSQFGMCKLGAYSCEEWIYFRGDCDVKGDAEWVYNALKAKGLNLSDMKVVINRHLGKYIGALSYRFLHRLVVVMSLQ